MKKTINIVFISIFLIAVFCVSFCVVNFSTPAYAECDGDYAPLYSLIGENYKNFKLDKVLNNAFGEVYRYKQYFGDMEVVGGEYIVALNHSGEVAYSDDNSFDIKSVYPSRISEYQAVDIVKNNTQNDGILSLKKVVCVEGEKFVECYKILSAYQVGTEFLLSAVTGDILKTSKADMRGILKENTNSFGESTQIDVEFLNNKYYLHDDVRNIYIVDFSNKDTSDIKSTFSSEDCYSSLSGTDFNHAAVTAYQNIIKAYDFYTNENFVGDNTRNGINDQNDNTPTCSENEYKVYVLMNFGKEDSEKSNAQFGFIPDGTYGFMLIGAGVEKNGYLNEVERGLDVIAHEYQHGVTSSIVKLEYEGESGAVDEAIADIFGALIEGEDPTDLNSGFWKMCENCMYQKGDYLRALYDDNKQNATQVYNIWDKQVCNLQGSHDPTEGDHRCDNNFVHANSTIISTVQYQLNKLQPTFFTREKISQLWFATLTMLNTNATFSDFVNCFISSAINLNYPSTVMNSVYEALTTVGLLHRVLYLNEDNSVFLDRYTTHGGNIAAPTETPTFVDVNDLLSYRFENWAEIDSEGNEVRVGNGSLNNITNNIVFKAKYQTTPILHTITFLDIDGNVIEEKQFGYTDKIVPPTVTPPTDDKYIYKAAWSLKGGDESQIVDIENSRLSRDDTWHLVFLKYIELRFVSEDTVVATYNDLFNNLTAFINNIESPTKQQNQQYQYVFIGWDKQLDDMKTGMDINAVFREVKRAYEVQFMVDGKVDSVVSFYYGDKIVNPLKVKGKIFKGWYLDEDCTISAEDVEVTSNMVVYARLESMARLYVYIGLGVGGALLLVVAIIIIVVVVQKRRYR